MAERFDVARLLAQLAATPHDARAAVEAALAPIAEQDLVTLRHDFFGFWARTEQLPPMDVTWRVWLALCGRGWGKTRVLAEAVNAWAYGRMPDAEPPPVRIAIVGQTVPDVRDVILHGPSGIVTVARPQEQPVHIPARRVLEWPNGSLGYLYSGDKPDQLRGPAHHYAAIDEFAKFQYPGKLWENLDLGLRMGARPRCAIATTPRPLEILRTIIAEPTTRVTGGATTANIANLSNEFLERVYARYGGTRLERQELLGLIVDRTPGANWSPELLDATRTDHIPEGEHVEMLRSAVAVDIATADPTGASEERSETGIISGCSAEFGGRVHLYIVADHSGRYTPREWARKALFAAQAIGATRVTAEQNQGGQTLREILERECREMVLGGELQTPIGVHLVRAAKGKLARAEPVAMLWEQGLAHLLGSFPELEDQLTNFIGDERAIHSDRHDALVWCCAALLNPRLEIL